MKTSWQEWIFVFGPTIIVMAGGAVGYRYGDIVGFAIGFMATIGLLFLAFVVVALTLGAYLSWQKSPSRKPDPTKPEKTRVACRYTGIPARHWEQVVEYDAWGSPCARHL